MSPVKNAIGKQLDEVSSGKKVFLLVFWGKVKSYPQKK